MDSPNLDQHRRPRRGGQGFSVGRVLSRTFQAYFANFVPVILLGAVALAPYAAFEFLYPYPDLEAIAEAVGPDVRAIERQATLEMAIRNLLGMGLQIFAGALAAGTVTYTIFQWLRGQRASFSESLGRGLRAILPIAIASLIIGVCSILGFAFCIVPGVILVCMWWVTMPAAVVERIGGIAALGRSSRLTQGDRWNVLGCIFVVYLVQYALIALVVVPLAMSETDHFGGDFETPSVTFLVATLAVTLLVAPLHGVASAVGYHDLRIAREGIDTEELAAVFD